MPMGNLNRRTTILQPLSLSSNCVGSAITSRVWELNGFICKFAAFGQSFCLLFPQLLIWLSNYQWLLYSLQVEECISGIWRNLFLARSLLPRTMMELYLLLSVLTVFITEISLTSGNDFAVSDASGIVVYSLKNDTQTRLNGVQVTLYQNILMVECSTCYLFAWFQGSILFNTGYKERAYRTVIQSLGKPHPRFPQRTILKLEANKVSSLRNNIPFHL